MQEASDLTPVGVFDSGVGGLTVVRELINELPEENIIYLGDTARVPYGVRSPETVLKYSIESANFLLSKGVKALVIACNTASAVSLEVLRKEMPVPVVGVVEPGARAAAAMTRNRRVAVIGTETTISSGSYEDAIKAIDSSISVVSIPCPLFVPLIEEGWLEGDIVSLTAEKYLSSVKDNGVDTLVLGCTHYPMIKTVIQNTVNVPLIDSAIETAREVKHVLTENDMIHNSRGLPLRDYYVTDAPDKFVRTGQRFLDHEIENITKINLEDIKHGGKNNAC